MSVDVSSVVLEEVLRRAMDEAVTLRQKPYLSREEEGALFAYFSMLDWGKQQADLMGVELGDAELRVFDPYSLLAPPNKIAA